MALAGAPPSNQVIPGGALLVLGSTVKGLSNAKLDCGDNQIAYHNIGLASTARNQNVNMPNSQQLDDYIRRLGPVGGAIEFSSFAQRSNSKDSHCTAAIRLLRGFKNSRWNWGGVINIDPAQDQATNTPAGAPAMLPLNWPQLRARHTAHNRRLQHRIDTFDPLGSYQLSIRERDTNSDEQAALLVRYWDAAPRIGGFYAHDGQNRPQHFHVMNWPEDGNSLWYTTHLFAIPGGRDDWALMKAEIWKYFNYVIHHPSHWRHRLYVHLERESWTETEEHSPGSERLWGRMSILRALHLNTPDSGPPMYGNFAGMMQVIADYFCKEVVLVSVSNAVQVWSSYIRKRMKVVVLSVTVFGNRNDGQVNGQILLVTDEIPGQYQVVTHYNHLRWDYRCRMGPQDPPNPGLFDTSAHSVDDRFGWIEAPWMPPRPLPAQWQFHDPVLIPALDFHFHVFPHSDEWWQFTGRGEAVDDDDSYGRGAVPILPAGWQTERMAPLPGPNQYPEFPYGFGNRMIVTGVYQDANGREWWPQWNNILAYRAHQFRQLAIERDLPTSPHKLSQ
ncbi:hypothetical protein CHU98_g1431 [Xylaria longipes]|nr:hypothetical protein CHU98_g1431 [Xylaria longipes]